MNINSFATNRKPQDFEHQLNGAELVELITIARRAGASVGTADQDYAYAELVLNDRLFDEERERLGYATHMITRAKQAGYASNDLWRYIQSNVKDYRYYPVVKIAALAFSAGLCHADREVSLAMYRYMQDIMTVRDAGQRLRLVPSHT